MIDGLEHTGTDHECSICQCEFTDDEGGIQGYIGIIPVSFCPTCFSGICDMVEQLYDRQWEGLTELEKAEITSMKWWDFEDTFDIDGFIRAVETKLKEKNYEGED
jgi:hypothetical protein